MAGGNAASMLPLPTLVAISSFAGIAWYNVVVLNVMIFLIFKRWSGLYFYMLLVASWGIFLHELGVNLMLHGPAKDFAIAVTILNIGWYSMVTGQSLVLYSRLHLVFRDTRKIRWVLYMIIIDAIIFHIPTTVLFVIMHSKPSLATIFPIWEKIQVTAFAVQEVIISVLYIYETRKRLQPSAEFQRNKFQVVLRRLINANVVIILLDIAILCVQYAGLFNVQLAFKGAAYSMKVFLEFFILNQLREAVNTGVSSSGKITSASFPCTADPKLSGHDRTHGDVMLNTTDTLDKNTIHVTTQVNVDEDSRRTSAEDEIHVSPTFESKTRRNIFHSNFDQARSGLGELAIPKERTSTSSSKINFAKQ